VNGLCAGVIRWWRWYQRGHGVVRTAGGVVLEIRLLGEVTAYTGGEPVPLGPARQRLVLAALAVDAGRVVSVDQLVARVWGEAPPSRVRGVLSSYVSRLRTALGAERLVWRSGGYLLAADAAQVDLHRFRELHGQARTSEDDVRAVELLTEALALWRGEALTGLGSQWVLAERDRLHQLKLLALHDLTDARLRAGTGESLVAELFGRVAELPLDERIAAQYMQALYLAGRVADALEHYRRFRTRLADELGTDPGAALQELQQRILHADPALASPGQRQAGVRASAAAPVPRQLPADIANFAGREHYFEQLDGLLNGGQGRSTVLISAIAGVGGVGKTALALHWAHRVAARYPDAHLYVNLRGYASAPPMTPADVLPMFLRALGVAQPAIPLDEQEQSALYRSLLADRRALIVLDNAAAAEQVRPLLPGGPRCLVLVTSRDDLLGLTALDDAHRLVLDVLPAAEAHTLLTLVLGADRVAAEPEAAAGLARLCGFLPLALRIAAAHLAADPRRTIADYVARLGAGDRLTRLAIGEDRDAAVRASFDLSYQTLDAATARLFRLLGCAPGPECGVPAAAALIDAPAEETTRLLDRLATAHLIESPTTGRYTLHDLLRLYAAERALEEDPQEERDGALRRLFDMYLHTAHPAAIAMFTTCQPIMADIAGSGERALPLAGPAQAKEWLDTERVNLVAVIRHAAEHGPQDVAWRLAAVLAPYFYGGMSRSDWLEVSELGLRAARELRDQVAEGAMMHFLHRVHFAFGDYDKALEFGLRGRELFPLDAHPGGEAEICKQFGHTYWLLGRPAESLENFTRARDLSRRIGNRVCELVCMNGMALSYLDWGRLDDVLDHTGQALALHRQIGSLLGEAAALHIRAYALAALGKFDEALDDSAQALVLYHRTAFRFNEASLLSCMAEIHRDTGRYPLALENGHRALSLAAEFHDSRGTSLAHTALAGTYLALTRLDDAAAHVDQAVRVAEETGYRRAYVDALIGQAAIERARGEHDTAIQHATTALQLARDCDFRGCIGLALTVLAETHLDRGADATAAGLAGKALAIHREIGHHLGEARTLRVFAKLEAAR
jgi:DNA-binding SARP family transcriptional activator/tetratricopeptide (TPR) repeat protein